MEETYRNIINILIGFCQNNDLLPTDSDKLIPALMDLFGYCADLDEADVEAIID